MHKFNIKFLIYLPIIFFFLPAFSFFIPGLHGVYSYFFITLYITVILMFLIDTKYVIDKLIQICRITPMKYFILSLIFATLSSIALSLLGVTSFSITLRSFILRIILCILPLFIYFICILDKYISLKKFIKIFLFLLWIDLIIVFFAYIGQFFNISIINDLFDFFANARHLSTKYGAIDMQASLYEANNLPRLDNLFEEPAMYAQFLFLCLPIIYAFSNTKLKIFKNVVFNKIFKITFIPFCWISIILTLSPIFLILSLLITIIYYWKSIFIFTKKYLIFIFTCMFGLILYIKTIDFSDTYIARIINIMLNVRSFNDFILIEPSLATRVISYINIFAIFLKNPLLGVGMGNISNASIMYPQFLNSPVPFTSEIIFKTQMLLKTENKVFLNVNFLYTLLAEIGIIAASFFIYFYYLLIKKIYIIRKNI